MAKRLIGTGATDANGNVIIPYVGTGAGLLNLVAETTIDDSITSEPYEVLDCLVKTANDLNSITDLDDASLATFTFDGEYVDVVDGGASGQHYISLYWNNSTREINGITLADLLDKTLKLDLEYQSITGDFKPYVFGYKDNNFTTIYSSPNPLSNGENSFQFDIPSDTERVWIRLQATTNSYHVKTKNWRLYPI